MALSQDFLSALTEGWDSKSLLVFVACVVLAQMSGFLWYGPLFGKLFLTLEQPDVKSEEDLKRFMDEFAPNAPKAYGSAMLGSALVTLLMRACLIVFEIQGATNGAFLGVLLTMVDTCFGIMHPFFDDKPHALYFMHRGYHLLCFSLIGAVLAMYA